MNEWDLTSDELRYLSELDEQLAEDARMSHYRKFEEAFSKGQEVIVPYNKDVITSLADLHNYDPYDLLIVDTQ